MRRWLLVLAVAGWAAACNEPEQETRPITVFAASSLTDALEALADSFETAHPAFDVVLNVAATSLLARQIDQGAPADVFFAAHPDWTEYLEERGRIEGTVAEPLGNRLVVVGPAGSPPMERPERLLEVGRLALADPEHVPAGRYAREALACLGLWDEVQPSVVPTLDVRAALLTVRNGAAGAGIVYASDVEATSGVQVVLTWPERCQPDIRYAVARLRGAPSPEGAALFLAFAVDPARAALWERFGFRFR